MLRLPLLLLLCVVGVHCHDHLHTHAHDHSQEPIHLKYTREANVKLPHVGYAVRQNMRSESAHQLWGEVSAAILIISLAPFFLLCLLPDLSRHRTLLKIFLAFAAGGLLGDAFLHLIPHAIDRHHHDHSQTETHDHKRHMVVGISIVAGIFLFLCIEKMVRVFQRGLTHSHGHGSQQPPHTTQPSMNDVSHKSKKGKKTNGNDSSGKPIQRQQQQQSQAKRSHKQNTGVDLKVAGYLNLAADFTHNFTDGLAIGASFLISRNTGVITTLTVLIHELPHEIGDYAILIQSGCSARKAMLLQLSTAVGAAFGASISLLAAGVGLSSFGSTWNVPVFNEDLITGCILPFTAGGFIYIAMTSVLPDLLEAEHDSTSRRLSTHWCRRLTQSLGEVFALVSGISMMAALGLFEQ